MAARMALCVEQTRQTVAALDIRRSQVDDEDVYKRQAWTNA